MHASWFTSKLTSIRAASVAQNICDLLSVITPPRNNIFWRGKKRDSRFSKNFLFPRGPGRLPAPKYELSRFGEAVRHTWMVYNRYMFDEYIFIAYKKYEVRIYIIYIVLTVHCTCCHGYSKITSCAADSVVSVLTSIASSSLLSLDSTPLLLSPTTTFSSWNQVVY